MRPVEAPMRTPLLLVNFKNYVEIEGEAALRLAETAEGVAKDLGVEIAVAPPTPYLAYITRSLSIPVFAQHVDAAQPGSTTGAVVPDLVKAAGASGSIVSHSERKLPFDDIQLIVRRLRELGMCSMVCAGSPEEIVLVSRLGPDFAAIEPPELIGSGRAVSKVRPEVITESVEAVQKVNSEVRVICGAGITGGKDVDAALRLGSKGVLVASGVVKAKDWRSVLKELAEPLTRY